MLWVSQGQKCELVPNCQHAWLQTNHFVATLSPLFWNIQQKLGVMSWILKIILSQDCMQRMMPHLDLDSQLISFCLSPFEAKTTILWNVLVNPKKIQKKDVTMKPAIFITPNSIDIEEVLMSAPNAEKSLAYEFSNYILMLQKRSIGSCEIKQLHGILFQKRSISSCETQQLHRIPKGGALNLYTSCQLQWCWNVRRKRNHTPQPHKKKKGKPKQFGSLEV